MSGRHERASELSPIIVVALALCAVSAAQSCEDLQCLNSNPCQSFLRHDNTTHARCICGGRWAGRRCQHQIRLKPELVTSSQAQLKVEVMTSQSSDVTPSRGTSAMSLVSREREEEEEAVQLNYTLVYWRRNDTLMSVVSGSPSSALSSGDVSCVLLHKRKSRQPTLEGLSPSTWYTICVENGFIDSCVLSSLADSASPGYEFPTSSHFITASPQAEMASPWPSNCVTIYTIAQPPAQTFITQASTVTIVAGVSVLVLVVLIVVLILFLVRRQNVSVRLLMDGVCYRCCCGACGTNTSSEASQDRTRLSQSSSHAANLSTTYLEDDLSRASISSSKGRKRTLLQRLKSNRKRPKSSTYTSASMLLEPPPHPSSTHSATLSGSESSPLGSGFDIDDLDDSVFENLPEPPAGASAAPLPAIHAGRNRPRRRLSRRRRGYVAYSMRKDKNIRLTTVLESPHDDDDGFDVGFLEFGHSSI